MEAIVQNLVATGLWIAATALVAFLLSEAGNVLTVRVWWLAVGVVLLAALITWLTWLTAHVRALQVRVLTSEEKPAAAPVPPPHPHQELLDRMDAMIEQLAETSETHISWQTGQTYNDLMAEARTVDERLNLRSLPIATELAMYSGSSLTEPSPKELAGGLRQGRIHVARSQR